MLLIAENLNSSVPAVHKAIAGYDLNYLTGLIQRLDAGPADYLDLNAGLFHKDEAKILAGLVKLARQHSSKPLMLDSPDPDVLASACPLAGPGLILNSVSLEKGRFSAVSKLAQKYKASVVALLMNEDKFPANKAERLAAADEIVGRLTSLGLAPGTIFLDPLITPLATDDQAGITALETIKALKQNHPQCHIIVGLSNISYGLPQRKHLNRAFLVLAMAMGLDSAILNILDEDLVGLARAQQSLSGRDEYCLNYLEHYR
jgi:5-methyltetrahydrofolate--homocysteine methyltransferase